MARIGLKIACVLVVAVGGGCSASSGGASSADGSRLTLGNVTWTAPASGQSSSCSIIARNTEVLLYAMLNDVSPACAALGQGLSSGDTRWSNGSLATVDQSGTPIQFTVACALSSSADDEQVTVLAPSSGSLSLGKRVCARFERTSHGGWRHLRSGTTTTLASAGY